MPLQCSKLLVTGGSGFIGSAFIRRLLSSPDFQGKIVNLDALTYAVHPKSLAAVEGHPRYRFIQGNILDQPLVEKLLLEEEIDALVHFAAESHVDRSIDSAAPFAETNILGTLSLLEAVRKFPTVHFHHVSTDEVYGSLGESGTFSELSPYRPNSPYSASKAASDHFVRAYAHTYGLSTTLSHCSNNYGPYQHREKLIPRMILNAVERKPLPVYGRGANVRDWLHVEDHVDGLWRILSLGKRGEVYDFGGGEELSNLELVEQLLELIAQKLPSEHFDYRTLIRFVADRAGHDFRYAIDSSKARRELGWKPRISLKQGLKRTVDWYYRSLTHGKTVAKKAFFK